MNEKEHTTRRAPHMERFTEIRPVIMEDYPNAQNVFLKVRNQRFCISTHGCKTMEDAIWLRDMLCIALDALVHEVSEEMPDRTAADEQSAAR